MAISATCACGRKIVMRDALAGKRIRCPQCQGPVQAPAAAEQPPGVVAPPLAVSSAFPLAGDWPIASWNGAAVGADPLAAPGGYGYGGGPMMSNAGMSGWAGMGMPGYVPVVRPRKRNSSNKTALWTGVGLVIALVAVALGLVIYQDIGKAYAFLTEDNTTDAERAEHDALFERGCLHLNSLA